LTVSQLKRVHRQKRGEIRARLADFARIRKAASDEQLFEELTFCIFTAGASARMGLRSVERIRPLLMSGSRRRLQGALRKAHRFPNARGSYVFETRQYLWQECGMRIRDLMEGFENRDELRDFFAANPAVRGLGYKEASHFLRNVGLSGYAILDKHVISRLAEFRVIDEPKPPSTRNRYLEIELRMKAFAERIGIDFDELDLLLWYTKTGEILK
jgi:N-glycosylase/DNA lyase